jgi:hypothetical protein
MDKKGEKLNIFGYPFMNESDFTPKCLAPIYVGWKNRILGATLYFLV